MIEKKPLSNILQFKNGKKRPKDIGTVPVYGGNGILGYANAGNSKECVIIGRVGAYCGSVYFEKNDCWISDNAIGAYARNNTDIVYAYYLLKSQCLNERRIGTSQPLLTQEILNNIEVPILSYNEQINVGRFLGKIDEKIELNTKINENLEQQAQAYFEDLFVVNADPNWPECTLSDIGSIVAGGTPSKSKPEYYADQGIAWITPKDLSIDKSKFISHGENDISELGFSKSSAKKMPAGTVLFSSRAPIGFIAIAQNELTTNQGFKSVIPNEKIGTSYVYFLLKNLLPTIEGMASGSTFKEISGAGMKSVPTVMPDVDTIQFFNNFCEPIFKEQEILEAENRRLSALRDSLLPKLMSGEIDISSLDI